MLRTKTGLPKHCCWNEDQHGKRRVRFRKGSFSVYITGGPWSEDFMRQYAAALEGVKARRAEIGAAPKPGSFNALCVSYYRSPEFRGLKLSTQAVRRNIIERFRLLHGDKPVRGLGRAHIKEIMGVKADTPEVANNLLKVLRVMLDYAVDQQMIESNPAIGVKKYRSRGEGQHSWTDVELRQFDARHPLGSKAYLAKTLGYRTAQRKSDVVRMGWQHVTDNAIAVRQEKTDAPLLIPIHPELTAALASVPRTNLTFLTTDKGAPFTPVGFGNWFRDQCDAAGLPQCSFHGLRKAAATRLANAGCSTDQIKAVTGHKSLSEVARYTKAADQQRLSRQALDVLLRAEGEQKLSNLPTRLDKNAAK